MIGICFLIWASDQFKKRGLGGDILRLTTYTLTTEDKRRIINIYKLQTSFRSSQLRDYDIKYFRMVKSELTISHDWPSLALVRNLHTLGCVSVRKQASADEARPPSLVTVVTRNDLQVRQLRSFRKSTWLLHQHHLTMSNVAVYVAATSGSVYIYVRLYIYAFYEKKMSLKEFLLLLGTDLFAVRRSIDLDSRRREQWTKGKIGSTVGCASISFMVM